MKKNFILCLMFFSLTIFSQENIGINDSIIYWNEGNKLTWNDFKIEHRDSIKPKKFHATASTSLSVSYSVDQEKIEFIVYSKFFRFNSHVSFKTRYLLEHEQLHFDIVELFARKLRKQYINLKKNNATFEEYTSIYKKTKKDLKSYQKLYDFETCHSKNKKKQEQWSKSVLSKLKELEIYDFDNYLDSIR